MKNNNFCTCSSIHFLPGCAKVCLLIISILLSSLYSDLNAHSTQNTVSVQLNNTTIKNVLKKIEESSSYVFFYSDGIKSDIEKKVSISFQSAPIKKILDHVLDDTQLKYTIEGYQVSIFANRVPLSKPAKSKEAKVLISGTVFDPSGEALIGATVRASKDLATTTDINGRYSIEIPIGSNLTFSYLGFVNQTALNIQESKTINITLKEDLKLMSEVVVVGYGTQQKSNISSSIGTYKPSEINARAVLSADQMLQGRVAGVNITSASGIPGGKNRVSIRGTGSLSASNEPLYVIDGVPIGTSSSDLGSYGESMNALATLNPDDIESIEILKDAASAAIYGSRATNGVIIITTKSGKRGDTDVSVSLSSGISQLGRTNKLKMAGSDLYLTVMNEAIDNWNLQTGNSVARLENPYPNMPDTDWLDLLIRTAITYNANIAISGGSDKMAYYISGNMRSQEGIFEGNRMDKYNLKTNLNGKVKEWFSVGTNLNLSYTRNNRVPSGYNIGTNLIPRALEQRPWDRPYKPNGDYYISGSQLLNHNPIQALNEENVHLDNYRILGTIYADFKITDNISFKSSLGGDVSYTEDYIHYKAKHPYGNGTGKLTDGRRLLTNLLVENVATYKNKFFDDNLFFDAIAGHSFQEENTSLSGMVGLGFPSDSFDVNTVAAEIIDAYTNLYGTAIQSYFARTSFSWRNRYLLSASMRADGSSRFAPKKRYGYFPSVSAGWNVSEEDFWKFRKTNLKLRASYGSTGNQAGIAAYGYQALSGGGYNYLNSNGIAISNVGNPDLTWEKANQFDLGVDASFFNGALSLVADYFVKNTNNLLYDKPTFATSGFTSISSNIGSMRNNGFEFGASTNLYFGDLNWKTEFNIAFIKNKLTSLIDDNPLPIGTTHVLKVGEEVGSFYMAKQLGIYQYDDEVPAALYATGVRAGDVIYEDLDGNDIIDANDKQIVGSANPKFSGGFNNTFSYKGFDLSFFFTYSYGNKVYEMWTGGYRLGNGAWPMLESQAENRWIGPGTSNSIPRAIYGLTYNSTSFPSTRYLHDGSYIRLRNLTFGYNLPKSIISKLKINNLRVYAQMDNLFILTSYPMLDPEVNVSLSASSLGQDFLLPSQPRSINFGINLNF